MNNEELLYDLAIPDLVKAWERYQDVAVPALTSEQSQRFGELRRRVKQVVWLLNRTRTLLQDVHSYGLLAVFSLGNEEAAETSEAASEELILICETFYWVANRLREVPMSQKGNLPGFTKIIECEEVRLLRNRLIEHNEGASEEFSLLGANGPVLRGQGHRGVVDPGMFLNANKLCRAVKDALEIATAVIKYKKDLA